jgi:hypothetical protein
MSDAWIAMRTGRCSVISAISALRVFVRPSPVSACHAGAVGLVTGLVSGSSAFKSM